MAKRIHGKPYIKQNRRVPWGYWLSWILVALAIALIMLFDLWYIRLLGIFLTVYSQNIVETSSPRQHIYWKKNPND